MSRIILHLCLAQIILFLFKYNPAVLNPGFKSIDKIERSFTLY